MGAYDDITPDELRERLVHFATVVLALEEEGELLEHSPEVMKVLGELRRMIFAWEVRGTGRLAPDEDVPADGAGPGEDEAEVPDDPVLEESLRVVREALEREEELQDELRGRLFPDDDEA